VPYHDCEAIMAHALAHGIRRPRTGGKRARFMEDALDPIRGILIGTLLSIAGFWLPLALALTQ
jgi:hypothetical protein